MTAKPLGLILCNDSRESLIFVFRFNSQTPNGTLAGPPTPTRSALSGPLLEFREALAQGPLIVETLSLVANHSDNA